MAHVPKQAHPGLLQYDDDDDDDEHDDHNDCDDTVVHDERETPTTRATLTTTPSHPIIL